MPISLIQLQKPQQFAQKYLRGDAIKTTKSESMSYLASAWFLVSSLLFGSILLSLSRCWSSRRGRSCRRVVRSLYLRSEGLQSAGTVRQHVEVGGRRRSQIRSHHRETCSTVRGLRLTGREERRGHLIVDQTPLFQEGVHSQHAADVACEVAPTSSEGQVFLKQTIIL